MKGPYERLKYYMQRVWECPECRHHERTGGDVTVQTCQCQRDKDPVERQCMKLIEDGVRRTR